MNDGGGGEEEESARESDGSPRGAPARKRSPRRRRRGIFLPKLNVINGTSGGKIYPRSRVQARTPDRTGPWTGLDPGPGTGPLLNTLLLRFIRIPPKKRIPWAIGTTTPPPSSLHCTLLQHRRRGEDNKGLGVFSAVVDVVVVMMTMPVDLSVDLHVDLHFDLPHETPPLLGTSSSSAPYRLERCLPAIPPPAPTGALHLVGSAQGLRTWARWISGIGSRATWEFPGRRRTWAGVPHWERPTSRRHGRHVRWSCPCPSERRRWGGTGRRGLWPLAAPCRSAG